ncbi:unnamed protein product [Didymodactylos carnosus]|uniref:Uncharacterized protein n=1 Tax=Didymodactylos carnosus TaxID=1234261 RepID=A0A814CJ62_9BILA|nr:unnamed protein product [Didymodactylos carnosus]CAF1450316.1 unnamed protein product [Didymodactylos carnosus]CAF3717312.1 unnamed protein product [Didymodactylos carnosus]CAF4245241.1 unnamed protein product [Didymodactylos carnosus]
MQDNLEGKKKLPRPDLRVPNPLLRTPETLTNLRSRILIIGTVLGLGIGIGVVFVYPYMNIEKFKRIQKTTRAELPPQETLQPAGLPVWRDPFDRKRTQG